ncbi:MAG: hypothetical protein ACREV5_18455 [Steroidobacter sp.]
MHRGAHGMIQSAVLAAMFLSVCTSPAHAIDAPKPQPPPSTPEQAQRVAVTPTDQHAFYATMQRAAHTRMLRGLKVAQTAIDALARGEADVAVAALSTPAAQGAQDANVALVRVQHWCNRIASSRPIDPQAKIAKLSPNLSTERSAKAAGVIHAEAKFLLQARESCGKSEFDYRGIEARLRAAADAGHPASAVELAQFVRDPKQREALLQSAIDKGYAPAMYAVATNLLVAVQRGQTTENVSSIRLLLKQAGRSLPKAKLDLANCMALGCDGHPADAPTARAFGLDAARDGEPTAFVSMVRMPWGGRLTRIQHLAWQYFGDRLNEAGCTGEAYIPTATVHAQTIAMLEKGQDEKTLAAAKAQAEDLWRDNSVRAMAEQGCAEESL